MKKYLILLLLPVFLSGCFQVQTEPKTDGGIYRSRDGGENFEQITKFLSTSGNKNFSNDNSVFLMFDPSDKNTIYYSSQESGLLVSYNSGGGWRSLLENKGTVLSLEIDPENPCALYAATKQNIFTSNDCGRIWETTYLEKVSGRTIKDLVIDLNSPNRLFLFLSDGSILLSEDKSISWQVWSRFEKSAKKVFVNPKNPQIMYLSNGSALFKSVDQGLTWENLSNIIQKDFKFTGGASVKDLIFLSEYDDGFLTVSKYGILKSPDGGETWEDLPLLPKPKKETVLSLTVNPDNMNELYYSTLNAIYYSNDGGLNWKTIKSPTSRRNQIILMHPVDAKTIYIGVYTPPKN